MVSTLYLMIMFHLILFGQGFDTILGDFIYLIILGQRFDAILIYKLHKKDSNYNMKYLIHGS